MLTPTPTTPNFNCNSPPFLIKIKRRAKNKFEEDTRQTFQVIAPKLISNMHNKFEEDTWETFQVIAPTRSNYWRKRRKIAISWLFWIFFPPLLNLSKNYLLVTCITNLTRICEKLFKLSRPQGQIIDVKGQKWQQVGHFEFFFDHYWTCPRTGH